jgi:hypothetical protein
LIFINDLAKSDYQLFNEYFALYTIKLKERDLLLEQNKLLRSGRKRKYDDLLISNVSSLSPTIFNSIQSFLPSTSLQFITQYLLAVSCEDPEKFGISKRKKHNLIMRMTEALKNGYMIKERESLSTNDDKKLRRLVRIKCEEAKIFVNKNISLHRKENSLKITNNIL